MVRELLKHGTRARHTRTEGALRLMQEGFGQDEYRAYLLGQLAFFAAAEATLRPWLGEVPDLDAHARWKEGRLRADLAELGVVTADREGSPQTGVPEPRSLPEALGMFYVFEGSTLGGQLIVRHLRAKWPTLSATRFLDPYGERTGAMWRSFVAVLERDAVADPEGALGAANATFDALHLHLTR